METSVKLRALPFNRTETYLIASLFVAGNIILPQAYPNSIVIPCNATFEIQDMIFVYKVVDGKAASCALNVLLANDAEHYIVTSGLNEGDVIVTEGVGLLRDGSVIETMEE